MWGFIINHWRILLTIYAVGAVVTFVATAVLLIRALKEDDEELIEMDSYEPSEANRFLVLVVILVAAALIGVLWCGLPIIAGGVLLLDAVQERFPHIMGGLSGKDDKEE